MLLSNGEAALSDFGIAEDTIRGRVAADRHYWPLVAPELLEIGALVTSVPGLVVPRDPRDGDLAAERRGRLEVHWLARAELDGLEGVIDPSGRLGGALPTLAASCLRARFSLMGNAPYAAGRLVTAAG
jgi:hypothetical protein